MAEHAYEVLQSVQRSLKAYGLVFPKTLSRATGLTRAEVVLALWILRHKKMAGARQDGRWLYVSPQVAVRGQSR